MSGVPGASALVEHDELESLFERRNKALSLYAEALATMRRAHRAAATAGSPYGVYGSLDPSTIHAMTADGDRSLDCALERFRARLDRDLWEALFRRSSLAALMDATARKHWKDTLAKHSPPATLENLSDTLDQLRDNSALIFRRGVVRVFQRLDGRYARHDAFKIATKIIVRGYLAYSAEADELADLERILHVLDARPPPSSAGGIAERLRADHWDGLSGARPGTLQTEYLDLKIHKNGNVHVRFRRADLLERCNEIVAAYYGECLPDGR